MDQDESNKYLHKHGLSCCNCEKIATWMYMPDSKITDEERLRCDEHVPRGCSCNEEPIDGNYENGDPSNWKHQLDSQGRKLPCCEWWNLVDRLCNK